MEKITLRNSVHGTVVKIQVDCFKERIRLSKNQIRKIEKTLCPNKDCILCKGGFKISGPQSLIVARNQLWFLGATDCEALFFFKKIEDVFIDFSGNIL